MLILLRTCHRITQTRIPTELVSSGRPTCRILPQSRTFALSRARTMSAQAGAWPSPIHSSLLSGAAISIAQVITDPRSPDGPLYHLESRPAEKGRVALVDSKANKELAPQRNVRTRVHEYGGGAATAFAGKIIFSDFGGDVYMLENGQERLAVKRASRPAWMPAGRLTSRQTTGTIAMPILPFTPRSPISSHACARTTPARSPPTSSTRSSSSIPRPRRPRRSSLGPTFTRRLDGARTATTSAGSAGSIRTRVSSFPLVFPASN